MLNLIYIHVLCKKIFLSLDRVCQTYGKVNHVPPYSHLLCISSYNCIPVYIFLIIFLYVWHISWMAYCRQDIFINAYCCLVHIPECSLHILWHISECILYKFMTLFLIGLCVVITYFWVAYYCLVYIFWISIAYFTIYFFKLPNASCLICECLLRILCIFMNAYCCLVYIYEYLLLPCAHL